MVRHRTHRVVLNASQMLNEIKAFGQLLAKAIPEMREKELQDLKLIADKEQWDYPDYELAIQGIEADYYYGIPKLAAYALLTILYSLAETQLMGSAAQIAEDRNLQLRPQDMSGKGIEQASIYLEKVAGLDVKSRPEWIHLQDLQKLRNIIVHRGGRVGKSEKNKKDIDYLLRKYKGKLSVTASFYPGDEELEISMDLCRDFSNYVELFLRAIFKQANFPGTGMWAEATPPSG